MVKMVDPKGIEPDLFDELKKICFLIDNH